MNNAYKYSSGKISIEQEDGLYKLTRRVGEFAAELWLTPSELTLLAEDWLKHQGLHVLNDDDPVNVKIVSEPDTGAISVMECPDFVNVEVI